MCVCLCVRACVLEREGVKLAIWCPLVYMNHTTVLLLARVVEEVSRRNCFSKKNVNFWGKQGRCMIILNALLVSQFLVAYS